MRYIEILSNLNEIDSLETIEGGFLKDVSCDINEDGLSDAFKYYQKLNDDFDSDLGINWLFINVDGVWEAKWTHYYEACI